jgi:hypothetical protein
MRIHTMFLALTSLGLAGVFSAACGSKTDAPAGGTTATTATTGTGGTTTSTGTGGTTTATTGTGGSMATLDCASYCSTIMKNCTGNNAQYSSEAACKGTCAAFPPGALSDMAGDTLGCRLYHAGAPAAGMPAMHCSHAGPGGGGVCGTSFCDAFCEIEAKVCPFGAMAPYADLAACKTGCGKFMKASGTYNVLDTDKNTDFCRMYHLTVAATDAASAMTHCAHTKEVSTACTK